MTQTLVVGLDAATWDIVEPLRREDSLPVLNGLINNGVSGTIESTTPPMTPLAWTSMATGVNPGKHGIYDFVEQDRESYRITPTDYATMPRPAVWDLLNAADLTAGVINFPMANPPERIDDFFISGIPSPAGAEIAYPQEVKSHIEATGFRTHADAPKDDPEPYFEELVDLTDAQCDLTLKLADQYDPDLLWTVFMGLDWAQHYLWNESIGGRDAVDCLYEHVDRVLGRLLSELDEPTVLVVSDHGAGPIENEIHLNSLLEEWGYLTRTEPDPSPLERLTNAVLRCGRCLWQPLPEYAKRIMWNFLTDEIVADVREATGSGQYDLHTKIDWRQTEAFSYGAMGRLFIHAAGDYPKGTVPSEEYEAVRKELINRLEGLTHPKTGEKLVEWAVPREAVYEGVLADRGPDILFATTDWKHMVYCDFDEEWIHPPRERYADHRPAGLFVLDGPGTATGELDADVTDIAPTLLHHHQLSVLEGMDGEVLTEALTTDEPVKMAADYEKTDRVGGKNQNEEVTEHLEDLGYL